MSLPPGPGAAKLQPFHWPVISFNLQTPTSFRLDLQSAIRLRLLFASKNRRLHARDGTTLSSHWHSSELPQEVPPGPTGAAGPSAQGQPAGNLE